MKHIHIVSFDVPYPYDYGGVIDVYHRCKALTDFGYSVILHCFEYGRGERQELTDVAHEIHYYKRSSNLKSLLSKTPLIVKSRENIALLNRLKEDDYPIIFEGQHTTSYLNHPALNKRIKLIRSHNVEHDYYRELAKVETNFFKRTFFKMEAKKLKKHENIFGLAQHNLTVSHKDQEYFRQKYNNAFFLPVANPLSWNVSPRETKNYVLMHGNLSVKENEYAVEWVLENIHNLDDFELIVAGRNPNQQLIEKLEKQKNCTLIISPSNEKLNELIRNAGVNLLITFQDTGIKHKLINALSNGGHVLANNEMVNGTGLAQFCEIANSIPEIKSKINTLLATPVSEKLIAEKIKFLESTYGLESHAKSIDQLINKANN